jgi:hypothetical protein
MRLQCPNCQAEIPASQMNAEMDTAICSSCDEAFVLSELLAEGQAKAIDLTNPPPGAWYRDTFDGWEAGASTRSWGALFIVPFTCVWSGFTLGAIYGLQIIHGKFNPVMSLFGIPFVLGTFALLAVTAMAICGKTTISVAGGEATLFSGAIGIGKRKQFRWADIESVKWEADLGAHNAVKKAIILEGPTQSKIRFGGMLNANRAEFLRDAFRSKLIRDARLRS